jgi:cellulose biosynthesis protein BcsQ
VSILGKEWGFSMNKIALVIADEDKDYVSCLVDYIMCAHSAKFAVTSFTETASLLAHLEEGSNPPGIVLAGEEFVPLLEQIAPEKRGLVIALSGEGHTGSERAINKYQYGEKIVNEMLRIFVEEAEASLKASFRQTHAQQQQKTKIMAVFSPVGGVGKTTIAVGASVQTAWEGKNCFYLNLENMASTPLYFTGEQEENFSGILYYLKNNSKNLSLHLETAKCIDPVTKIAYYQPPDNIIDFKEDIAAELRLLLQGLKATGQYERIFVDMSSEINKNNLAVLQACDQIVLVAEQNMSSLLKIQKLFQDLRLLATRQGWDISEKFNLVLNKVRRGDDIPDELEMQYVEEQYGLYGKGVMGRIPLVKGLTLFQEGLYRLDLNTEFGKVIYRLLEVL